MICSTCLVSVLRLVYIYPISHSPDITWDAPLATIWSCVEVNTAILCSCVPTMKSIVQRCFPMLLDTIRTRPVTEIVPGVSRRTDNSAGSMQKGGMRTTTLEMAPNAERGLTRYLPFMNSSKTGENKSKWYSSSTRSDMSSNDPTSVVELGSLPLPSPFSDAHAIDTHIDRTFGYEWRGVQVPPVRHEAHDSGPVGEEGSGRRLHVAAHASSHV